MQLQWDLSRTTDNSQIAIRELVRTCSMDDVQFQAVLAFENLGAGLLVDKSRLGEAIDALGGRKSERLARISLLVGLSGDGLPRTLRNSTGCVSAFNLVVACKTCYDDTKMANVLHELMINLGIYSTYPASPYQLVQLLNAVSGYADKLIPVQIFADLSDKALSRLRHSSEMPGLLSDLDPKTAAGVLTPIFTALRNEQVDRISLNGCVGGIWLATVLLWLYPSTVLVSLNGEPIFGDNSPRLCLNFCNSEDDHTWAIQEWIAEKNLSSIIVPAANELGDGLLVPLGLFPQRSAKAVLGQGHPAHEVELMGQLAGALVAIAVEQGTLISQETITSDPYSLPRAGKNHILPQLKLTEVCQSDFLSKYGVIAADFGWQVDRHFGETQARLLKSICLFLDNAPKEMIETAENHQNYLQSIHSILGHVEVGTYNWKDDLELLLHNAQCSSIVEPAVNIAAEALYSCLYKKDPASPITRYMQRYHYKRTMQNALAIWRIIFRPVHGIYGFSLSDLRRETFNSLLSDSNIGNGDQALVLANNGYVAFVNCLKAPSTQTRECVAIRALPGSIRSELAGTQFVAVYQAPSEEFPAERRGFTVSEPLEVFDGIQYQGLSAHRDPDAFEISHHLTTSERSLRIVTFMKSSSQDATVGLDWLKSIEAVAFAQGMGNPTVLSAFAEEQLAKALAEGGLAFSDICWLSAGGSPKGTNFTGYITMTSGDEVMRFFTAGRFAAYKLLISNGVPLMSCINTATEGLKAEQDAAREAGSTGPALLHYPWIIIA